MHIIKSLKRLRLSSKQLVVTSAFVVALGAAIGMGMAVKQKSSAASFTRDCTANAINNKNLNGGCGAASPAELVADARQNNPKDLQAIYAKLGLPVSEYNRFAKEARPGIAYRDGRIVVDGKVVATKAWSIGRSKKAHSWNWNGYWADSAQNVNRSDIPVMVMFNANGEMQAVIMNACGNPGGGEVVRNKADCTALTKSEVPGKKNTYSFKTAVSMSGNVSIDKVVYNFGDGKTTTKTDLSPVEHTFTKSSTVTVTVTFKLPGGKTKTVTGVKCTQKVTVLIPYYACVMLSPRTLNDQKTQFRFTVKTSQGNGAILKDADFTLDGKSTTNGVTDKDEEGNIYKDYSFDDDVEHTIVAKVNFNVDGGIQSKTCEAKVTPEKAPECPLKPGSGIPPESPECQEYCKPNIPVGDARCEETPTTPPAELPKTGMGSVLGIFAGTSAAGAVAHRVVASRRKRF